jgi:aryl-alcohol dehydrogenase-like predicted oxidoreductase
MNLEPTSGPAPAPVRFGLGCVTFGREITPDLSMTMLDFAWKEGWGMFDTAAAYGSGASERIVGEWYRLRQPTEARPILATKVLPPYTPETLIGTIRASLQRLQCGCVDVLYLHQWHETALRPEVLAALHAAVEQGLVRALGVSNFSAEQLERVLALQARHGFTRFRYLQNIHNYAVSAFDPALCDLCVREGVERIGYSPLGAGFLTGKYRGGVPTGTRFDLIPGHQAIYFTLVAQQRLAALTQIAARTGFSMVELALAWAARHPAVARVLIGGRSVAQLQQAIDAAAKVPAEVIRLLAES